MDLNHQISELQKSLQNNSNIKLSQNWGQETIKTFCKALVLSTTLISSFAVASGIDVNVSNSNTTINSGIELKNMTVTFPDTGRVFKIPLDEPQKDTSSINRIYDNTPGSMEDIEVHGQVLSNTLNLTQCTLKINDGSKSQSYQLDLTKPTQDFTFPVSQYQKDPIEYVYNCKQENGKDMSLNFAIPTPKTWGNLVDNFTLLTFKWALGFALYNLGKKIILDKKQEKNLISESSLEEVKIKRNKI